MKIGVSYRQAKRICKRVREKGAQGLLHGNVGRSPQHRISDSLRKRIVALSCQKYAAFNDRHFGEQLWEQEGVTLGRETVRKIRREAGILPKRKRRALRHRKRRERKAQEGWMVLWDGSPHPWFGPDHPPCCLMAAIDDATGAILAARFFLFEGTEGYLWLLRQIVTRYGIPVSIYQDRHGSLKRNDDHWTLEEELAGRQEPTQVGQALRALGIQPIFALSPQAKGRIERLFGTLQDRLGAELDLAKATTPLRKAISSCQPFYDGLTAALRSPPANPRKLGAPYPKRSMWTEPSVSTTSPKWDWIIPYAWENCSWIFPPDLWADPTPKLAWKSDNS